MKQEKYTFLKKEKYIARNRINRDIVTMSKDSPTGRSYVKQSDVSKSKCD